MARIFIFACLCWSETLSGRTDFAPIGAKWHYENPPFISPPWGIPALTLEVTGETILQSQLCRKIKGAQYHGGIDDPAYVFSRNDSVFFFSEALQRFELLYDFTAQDGDSWTIRGLASLHTFGPDVLS